MPNLDFWSFASGAALGLVGVGVTLWTQHLEGVREREARIFERKADAYLELVRLIQHEGLWIDTQMERWIAYTVAHPDDDVPMPEVAPRSVITDKATAATLLAAYGSPGVRRGAQVWRQAADRCGEALGGIDGNIRQDSGGAPPSGPLERDYLTHSEELVTVERDARKSVVELIASELAAGRVTKP